MPWRLGLNSKRTSWFCGVTTRRRRRSRRGSARSGASPVVEGGGAHYYRVATSARASRFATPINVRACLIERHRQLTTSPEGLVAVGRVVGRVVHVETPVRNPRVVASSPSVPVTLTSSIKKQHSRSPTTTLAIANGTCSLASEQRGMAAARPTATARRRLASLYVFSDHRPHRTECRALEESAGFRHSPPRRRRRPRSAAPRAAPPSRQSARRLSSTGAACAAYVGSRSFRISALRRQPATISANTRGQGTPFQALLTSRVDHLWWWSWTRRVATGMLASEFCPFWQLRWLLVFVLPLARCPVSSASAPDRSF